MTTYNNAATKTAAAPTKPMELTSPFAAPVALVVAAAAALLAEVAAFSEVVDPSLTTLTLVPLFMHISAAGSGAEAEKVISAHYSLH